ncbi:MAG: rplQ [Spartobacteria bacterium]|nr:rplQ [Spartobacteria bacterium]
MRHQKKTIKLGRTAAHRKSLLANQVCSLIEHERIKTTLAKAKAVRPLAERMVTLGKSGSLHARRTALAVLRQKGAVKKLFDNIAPRSVSRNGGYTRIVKLGQRKSDSAPVAFIEWVDAAPAAEEKEPKKESKEKALKTTKQSPTQEKESAPVAPEKETPSVTKESEVAPTPPAEESRPKKRKWFGRKSGEGEK